MPIVKWICENKECLAEYDEYVNGCPKCFMGRIQKGLLPLHFSVRPKVSDTLPPESLALPM